MLSSFLSAAGDPGSGDAAYGVLWVALLLEALCIVAVIVGTILLFPQSTRRVGAIMVGVSGGVMLLTFLGCIGLVMVLQ